MPRTREQIRQHRLKMRRLLKQEYWQKALELGYPPTLAQVGQDPKMHSISTYQKYWGMSKLLKALNLNESYRRPRSDGREYTEEYLLLALREKYRRDNQVPTYRGVTADYLMPSAEVYTRRFQCSWAEILQKAGIRPVASRTFRAGLTNAEMLERLRQLAHLLGYTPRAREVDKSLLTPRSETYARHFGSFYQALLAAHLQPTPRQTAAYKGGIGHWQAKWTKNPAP